MSDPYMIWTMRRTGGTSLASLLMRYAPFPPLEHEPFNAGRVWHHIVEKFQAPDGSVATEAALRSALRDRPVIKNCYDLHPRTLHALLLRLTTELGYRHIVLDRGNEADRVLSLALAAQTSVWGYQSARREYSEILEGRRKLEPIPEANVLEPMRRAQARRVWLADALEAAGITPHVVFFEEIYSPEVDGKARVRAIFRFLDTPMEPADQFEVDLHETVHEKSQGSARILPLVPNIAELQGLLASELPPADSSPWTRFAAGG